MKVRLVDHFGDIEDPRITGMMPSFMLPVRDANSGGTSARHGSGAHQ